MILVTFLELCLPDGLAEQPMVSRQAHRIITGCLDETIVWIARQWGGSARQVLESDLGHCEGDVEYG